MFLNTAFKSPGLCAAILAAGLGLSGAAVAQDDRGVANLRVDVAPESAMGAAAANRITIVDADIEAAITARIEDRLAAAGINVSVDLDRIEVATGYDALLGNDHSVISGRVDLRDVREVPVHKSFDVTATAAQVNAPSFDPDVTVLPASSDAFYDAMVEAFALGVTQTIDELPMPPRLP
jgi:hypothetical protein